MVWPVFSAKGMMERLLIGEENIKQDRYKSVLETWLLPDLEDCRVTALLTKKNLTKEFARYKPHREHVGTIKLELIETFI